MNISKLFIIVAIITTMTVSPVIAVESNTPDTDRLQPYNVSSKIKQQNKEDLKQKREECCRKDPIKALENRKLEIQLMLKDGKVTKEEAEKKIKRIDFKIKEIQDFNKLSLQQKKDKLINDCKLSVEKLVKEGKIDKNKANEIIKVYSDKLNNWDGNGYPKFHMRHHMKHDTQQ